MAKSNYRANRARTDELRQLIDEGIVAGAEVMADAVREKFAERDNGFLHGQWARGRAATIEISAPYTKRGVRRCDVYSAAERDGFPYVGAWEFGHHNLFTGKYERVETFAPALFENASNVAGVMTRQIQKSVRRMPDTGERELAPRSGGIQTSVRLREFGL